MKRSLSIYVAIFLVAGSAGWWVARERAAFRAHETTERDQIAADNEAKRFASYFSSLVQEADEAVISYRNGKDVREIRFVDRAWILRLAGILNAGAYTRIPPALWISDPTITLYKNQAPVLHTMPLGRTLRIMGTSEDGEFVVDEEVTNEILALAKEKEPNA